MALHLMDAPRYLLMLLTYYEAEQTLLSSCPRLLRELCLCMKYTVTVTKGPREVKRCIKRQAYGQETGISNSQQYFITTTHTLTFNTTDFKSTLRLHHVLQALHHRTRRQRFCGCCTLQLWPMAVAPHRSH
jgi:hypothetical protein